MYLGPKVNSAIVKPHCLNSHYSRTPCNDLHYSFYKFCPCQQLFFYMMTQTMYLTVAELPSILLSIEMNQGDFMLCRSLSLAPAIKIWHIFCPNSKKNFPLPYFCQVYDLINGFGIHSNLTRVVSICQTRQFGLLF